MRTALGRLLRAAGFSADAYASGEEFLAALSQHAPDCLLLDYHLPGMNGPSVQARLRHSGVEIPVVFITATEGTEEARSQALRSGAVAWLRKPVDDHTLMDASVVSRLHGAGLCALAYTVNDSAEARRLIALGIDGIITDAVNRFSPGQPLDV